MNEQLFKNLNIDSSQDINAIISDLEDKQFEYLQRSETANDTMRKREIADILAQIEEEITVLKQQKKNISSSVVIDHLADQAPVNKEIIQKNEEVTQKVTSLKQKEAKKRQSDVQTKVDTNFTDQMQSMQVSNESSIDQVGFSQHITSECSDQIADTKESNDYPDVSTIMSYYHNGEYEKAFPLVKQLSEHGSAHAQFILSKMYLNGQGVDPDQSRSLFWLEKSAENGLTDGQAEYGVVLVSRPREDVNSIKEGFKYLELAADKGSIAAMQNHVLACLDNKGTKKNIAKAMEYNDKLKCITDDSYEKSKMDQIKDLLKKRRKHAGNNYNPSNPPVQNFAYQKKQIPTWFRVLLVLIGLICLMIFYHSMGMLSVHF
ncbi:MAG: sel1 repeat family protein [Eubacterium sp.]|nr:sel1 repeat family protein [Eubacterium sp.]